MTKKILIISGIVFIITTIVFYSLYFMDRLQIYNLSDSTCNFLISASRKTTTISALLFIISIFIPLKNKELTEVSENALIEFKKKSKLIVAIVIWMFFESIFKLFHFGVSVDDIPTSIFYNLYSFLSYILWTALPLALVFLLKKDLKRNILMSIAVIYLFIGISIAFETILFEFILNITR